MKQIIIITAMILYSHQVNSQISQYLGQNPKFINTDIHKVVIVEINVFLDDISLPLNDYKIEIINKTCGKESYITLGTSNKLKVFLEFDQIYGFRISHKNYSTNTLDVYTIAPKERTWSVINNVYLYKNDPDFFSGRLAYSDSTKQFRYFKN